MEIAANNGNILWIFRGGRRESGVFVRPACRLRQNIFLYKRMKNREANDSGMKKRPA